MSLFTHDDDDDDDRILWTKQRQARITMTDTEFTLEAIQMLESQQCWKHFESLGQIVRNFTSIVERNPRLHGHWCTLSSTTKRILALEVALDLSIYF